MGELALKLGNLRRLPVVSTFHSQYKDDFLNVTGSRFLAELGVEYLVHRFWNRVPFMMVPTDFSGRVLRDYGWEGTYRIQPNGTDMKLPTPEEMAAARREGGELLGIPGNVPVLLFVGQHRWVKNPGEVIEAAAILKARGLEFLQVFIGGGRDAAEIERKAETAGLAGRVKFVGVVTDRALLGRYFARADLFTFPSTYDVDPLVVKEAAAWGTPSIVARNSSAAERIEDGLNGFLTGPDAAEMASLIADILERPDWRNRVGEQARRTVYLSWETVVKNLVETYREIIDEWRVDLWHRSLGKSAGARNRPSRAASRRSDRLKNQQMKRVRHKLGPDHTGLAPLFPAPSVKEPVRHRKFRTKTGRKG
jgi:glycosyltransferase involved in cell wall biosynthesis